MFEANLAQIFIHTTIPVIVSPISSFFINFPITVIIKPITRFGDSLLALFDAEFNIYLIVLVYFWYWIRTHVREVIWKFVLRKTTISLAVSQTCHYLEIGCHWCDKKIVYQSQIFINSSISIIIFAVSDFLIYLSIAIIINIISRRGLSIFTLNGQVEKEAMFNK